MKNSKKIFGMAVIAIFLVGTLSSCSPQRYRPAVKKKKTKKKRCNCPTFSAAEVINIEDVMT